MITGWSVRDRIPVGTRFSARPDRPWVPSSLLYNWYRFFPGGRGGRGVGLTPHPIWCWGPIKSRTIPLLTLEAWVAYKTGWNLPTCSTKPTFFENTIRILHSFNKYLLYKGILSSANVRHDGGYWISLCRRGPILIYNKGNGRSWRQQLHQSQIEYSTSRPTVIPYSDETHSHSRLLVTVPYWDLVGMYQHLPQMAFNSFGVERTQREFSSPWKSQILQME